MTQNEFTALWSRLGATGTGVDMFQNLHARYTESHRHYHNLEHIGALLREFANARTLCPHPEEVAAAIWFHDAIYDPKAKDNEERSAELAVDALCRGGLGAEICARVSTLILATKHNVLPVGMDAAVLVDADLSILGKPRAEFDRYEANIRTEYAWVNDADFRKGRAAVLQAFLARPQIYTTEYFRKLYEAPARENLGRSQRAL